MTDRRPKFDFVVVVCVGRSGSTLVQGLMNAIPRVLIRGENYFLANALFRAYRAAVKSKRCRRSLNKMHPTSPWFGASLFNPAKFAQQLGQAAIEQLRNGGEYDTVGFKEIRWGRLGLPEAGQFVEFCELAFGRCGWVLHTRPMEEVRKSGWWRKMPRRKCASACRRVDALHEYLRSRCGPSCFDSSLAAIVEDLDGWSSGIVEWGGWQGAGVLDRMREAAKVRHSYRGPKNPS